MKINITGNIQGLTKKLDEAKNKMKQTFQGAAIGGAAPFLTASIWGAALTAAYKFGQTFSGIITQFRELRAEANRLSTTTAQMSKLADMAAYSGTKLSDMTSVLAKLQDLQLKASLGSLDAAQSLAALGLKAEQLGKMTPAEQLKAVADALDSIPDPATRAGVSMAIFGKMPAEINAVGNALQGLDLESTATNLDLMAKGWDVVAGAIQQATKAMLGFGAVGFTLRSIGTLVDNQLVKKTITMLTGFNSVVTYIRSMQSVVDAVFGTQAIGDGRFKDKPRTFSDAAQKAILNKMSGTSGATIQAQPVDQLRRIGAFMPGGNVRVTEIAQEQVEVSKEIRDHIMRVYEAMKSVDNKTPEPTPKS